MHRMFTFVDMPLKKDIKRCSWCERDDLYRKYHDEEWGVPSHNDHYLFELLVLEFFISSTIFFIKNLGRFKKMKEVGIVG